MPPGLLEDILETRDTASGIETLNFMEPQSAADLIRDEHPQIIAHHSGASEARPGRRYSGVVR
ncbi:flagellar motor switch protein FliG [Escherichia coli]|uniref:Flagellar motor switch protein FliG n=1 Tax=Escherichia coli TaxID=562 RepID=A0A377BAA1_ECOLX|nr:flagellar motor switch protein FliG [Escherichia coli]